MRGRPKSENALFANPIQRDMLIIYWRKCGKRNSKIAEKLGISRTLVFNALERYPSAGFAKNLKSGRVRPCLQCDKDFERDKNHKWICPRCQVKYANSDPPLFELHDAGNLAKKIRAMREPIKPKRKWAWRGYESAAVRGPEGKKRSKLEKKLSQL